MNAPQFRVIKRVTLPVLKMKAGLERFFKITTPMETGKRTSDQMAPAEVMQAVDLETGELGLVIASTVLQNELTENYPEHAYVGKCFSILYTRVKGKKYNLVTLAEIEAPKVMPEFDPNAKADQEARAAAIVGDDDDADDADDAIDAAGDAAGDDDPAVIAAAAAVTDRPHVLPAAKKPAAKAAPKKTAGKRR